MSYPPPPPQGNQEWQGQPGPAYGGYPTQPYSSGQDPYGPPPSASGKATASLVLGVASMVIFCLGFVIGIPAIVVGLKARKEIRLSQGRKTGDGLALGGIITGIIGSLLGLAVLALVIATFALGSSLDDVVERTCDELAQDNDPTNDCT